MVTGEWPGDAKPKIDKRNVTGITLMYSQWLAGHCPLHDKLTDVGYHSDPIEYFSNRISLSGWFDEPPCWKQ